MELVTKTTPLPALAAGAQSAAAPWPTGMTPIGPIGSVINAPRTTEANPHTGIRTPIMATEPGHSRRTTTPAATNPFDNTQHLNEREELAKLRRAVAHIDKEREILEHTAARILKETLQPQP